MRMNAKLLSKNADGTQRRNLCVTLYFPPLIRMPLL